MQIDSSLTKDIRASVRDLRRSLPLEQRLQAESSIYRQIKNHPKISLAQNIAIFLSFDGELNTKPIIEYLWQQNKSVYLPIIHPVIPKQLIFLPYTKQTKLKFNKLGIHEPELDVKGVIPFTELDIIFTPLVAFDYRNYRIGMGGGYYDRLLENYHQKSVYPIGLAFKCQQVDLIPNQPWDIKLPEIICA